MFDKLDKGPFIAAGLTAAVSLITYGAGVIVHLDERIDLIEKNMQTLVDGSGKVKPSPEAMKAFYQIQAHESRLKDLEDAHPNDHK